MIVIVNYNTGNLGSVQNMVRKVGSEAIISSKAEDIKNASKLIFPGVGSFDMGMEQLRELNLIDILNKKVITEKIPVLGICLGMQLMTKGSEEGILPGLGWVNATTNKFEFSTVYSELKIPHMGWNFIKICKDHPLHTNFPELSKFYFVHSYFIKCNNPNDILFNTSYGTEFVSGFAFENIIGVQFHPEKSHKYGMKLIENFINLC